MSLIPDELLLKITVGGVDITTSVPAENEPGTGLPGLQIIAEEGKAIDTARFGIRDAGGFGIAEMDEVIISNPAGTVKYFGGVISNLEEIPVGPELHLICNCQDFTMLLEKSTIAKRWEAETSDLDVLEDIAAESQPPLDEFDFTSDVIHAGNVPKMLAGQITVRAALDKLATMTGASWYIDYDKHLHWYGEGEDIAPFNISDAPDYSTTYPCQNLRRVKDGTAIVNRVIVVGGNYLSDPITRYAAGTGQDVGIILPYSLQPASGASAISVWRNDGTVGTPVWTALTVKIANIDELAGANEVLWDEKNKVLELLSAWPNLSNAVKVYGRTEVPLRVEARSDDSYAVYGRWYTVTIRDTSIIDRNQGRQRANAELLKLAYGKTTLRCSVDQPGLKVGQQVYIMNDVLNLADPYIIWRVTINLMVGGYGEYAIELGDYIPDLYHLLWEMKQSAIKEDEWSEDDVLDSLLTWQDTQNIDGDKVATGLEPVPSTGPYKWGAFKWGFGKWGSA
jgi:hypothetical protein